MKKRAPLLAGPLNNVRVIEMVGLGPGPFCATMLADMGADVLRVDRKSSSGGLSTERRTSSRAGRTIGVDLKRPGAREFVLRLIARADVLIEGYRPGVMERLGLGPETCLQRNERLVYGRMTGWGQDGPLAFTAGHDINYIAISGALAAIGSEDGGPCPPLNLVGDFGGGAMMLAFGIACALFDASRSGMAQVIDASISDGAAMLMGPIYAMKEAGQWLGSRQANLLDGGAHFYTTYRCADGKWISVGAIESKFYAALLYGLNVDPTEFQPQYDRGRWQEWKRQLAGIFSTKPQAEWCAIFEGTEACFAPILDMNDAPQHPHNVARRTFTSVDGRIEPSPVPRFSRSVPKVGGGDDYDVSTLLLENGFDQEEITRARAAGIV